MAVHSILSYGKFLPIKEKEELISSSSYSNSHFLICPLLGLMLFFIIILFITINEM